jgi:hypothetical protein
MNNKIITAFLLLAATATTQAQKDNGRQQLNNLCGCFEVEFKYAETFSPDKNYKFHDRETIDGAVELALPVETSNNKVVIQHLLVIDDSTVVKHWREDWTYENNVAWNYNANQNWSKQVLPPGQVKGKWMQTVWEVSDAPRYQGYSQFVALDNKIIWQNTTNAPLPRREYTTRNDYNILRRTNRLNITDTGYVHEQDNLKIMRANGTDQVIAEEKGLNTYRRISDTRCAAAKQYWEKNKAYWEKVRQAWAAYFNTHNTITLKTKVDGKPLHDYLNNIMKEYAAGNIKEADVPGSIKTAIDKFVGSDEKVATRQ